MVPEMAPNKKPKTSSGTEAPGPAPAAPTDAKLAQITPVLSNGVRGLMQQYPSLSVTSFGKIRESMTGHEMPAREDVIRQVYPPSPTPKNFHPFVLVL